MHACLDLGSNSFHLLIGEWDDGRIQIIERLSEKVQLGENVRATGKISPRAFQRGLNCLQRFKLLMKQYPVEKYWALGTNTLRVASNAGDFIQAAKTLGIYISPISGAQEGVLIYAGVISALPESNIHRLIIDIGGGSTEVIVGKGHTRLLTESLAIGSVAWRDRFFSDDGYTQAALLQQMESGADAAREVFAAIAAGINSAQWSKVYGSSGTVKLLAAICQEHGYGKGQIQLRALYELKHAMAECIATGQDLPGLKERRRDLLLAGWSIMIGLMESFQVNKLQFSATALREGMLEFLVNHGETMQALDENDLPDVSFAKG